METVIEFQTFTIILRLVLLYVPSFIFLELVNDYYTGQLIILSYLSNYAPKLKATTMYIMRNISVISGIEQNKQNLMQVYNLLAVLYACICII